MRHELVISELEQQTAEMVPDRSALALLNIAHIYAGNGALAANVFSALSGASATANQIVVVTQL